MHDALHDVLGLVASALGELGFYCSGLAFRKNVVVDSFF
jgi:hypothetical protein